MLDKVWLNTSISLAGIFILFMTFKIYIVLLAKIAVSD